MSSIGPTPATMADVAAAAGVSRATVSRVLQDRGGFSRINKLRVLKAVRDLAFVPNVMATELASPSSNVVGLLLRDAANPAYGALFVELARAAREHEITLISTTVSHDHDGQHQLNVLRRLLGMRVAGLIVATGDVSSAQLEPFHLSLPILRSGRPETTTFMNAVSYDEADNATLIAQHVLAAGHSSIVVIQPSVARSYPEHIRAQTMIEVLKAGGAEVFVVTPERPNEGVEDAIALVTTTDATAVMAPTDRRQMDVMRGLIRHGLNVPQDVSVSGMDGLTPGADLLGLTTVRLPVEKLAARSMAVMARLIRGEIEDVVQERIRGVLIPGTTVAEPRPKSTI